MPNQNWQFELEEYIKQGEPDRAEKSEAWQTAIGLQAVDGLNTSAYLLDTAKDHIEGKITIDEAQQRIHSSKYAFLKMTCHSSSNGSIISWNSALRRRYTKSRNQRTLFCLRDSCSLRNHSFSDADKSR